MFFVWTVKSFVSRYGGLYIFWYYKVSTNMSAFLVMVLLLKKCCAQPAFKVSQLLCASTLCVCTSCEAVK